MGWLPAGEFHVPHSSDDDRLVSLSFTAEALLITTRNGEVHSRNLSDGISTSFESPSGLGRDSSRECRAACVAPTGSLIRLTLRRSESNQGTAWGPELLMA